MYIIIAGINNLSYQLGEGFITQGNEVTFIDPKQSNADRIEKSLGFLSILGNSYNKKTLLEAGVDRADYFIAAHQNDENNLVSSQITKFINSDIKVITLLNSKKNREIFLNDDFDYVVDYDEILGNSINSYISDYSNMSIFSDNDNYTEIRIMSAGTDSRIIGKSVSEIELPNNSKVIAIISSSGNISHNFSNTINSLDKIIFQVPINK